jgi:hypothetical protein
MSRLETANGRPDRPGGRSVTSRDYSTVTDFGDDVIADWIATLRGFAFSTTGIITLSTPLS